MGNAAQSGEGSQVRVLSSAPKRDSPRNRGKGRLAQMEERPVGNRKVNGSSPLAPTNSHFWARRQPWWMAALLWIGALVSTALPKTAVRGGGASSDGWLRYVSHCCNLPHFQAGFDFRTCFFFWKINLASPGGLLFVLRKVWSG